MTGSDWVTVASLLAGAVSFGFYCWATTSLLTAKTAASDAASQAKAVMDPDTKAVSVGDFTKLLDALSGLTTSLSKASPSLTSLIGAILMFAIAAVSSGAITGSPSAAPQQAPAAKEPKPQKLSTNETNNAAY